MKTYYISRLTQFQINIHHRHQLVPLQSHELPKTTDCDEEDFIKQRDGTESRDEESDSEDQCESNVKIEYKTTQAPLGKIRRIRVPKINVLKINDNKVNVQVDTESSVIESICDHGIL